MPLISAPMPLPLLKSPQSQEFSNPHAYPSTQRDPSSYYLSPPKSSAYLALPDSKPDMMSTPHRGLPPPSAMDRIDRVLPQPQADRGPPANNMTLGQLPGAPSQWAGQDESMRSWLHAKSEEDRRKQEEEKTRQEGLRLEQRKIEQNMLSESLRGGIPPPMVPMVFASMGGANVSNMSVEWAQHYMTQMSLQQQQQAAQLQQQQQQHQQQQQAQIQPSPEQRRDTRMLTGPNPNPYGSQQMQPPTQNASQPMQQPQAPSALVPSYQGSTLATERTRQQPPLQAAPPTSNPRPQAQQGALSRLNTGELQIQAPAAAIQGLQISSQHPLQQTQTAQQQDQASSSPTIYFHHYVPPGSHNISKEKDPGTPAGKNGSPHSQNSNSHLRSEYTTSPKKRKATGDHKAPPEPSPSFSHHSSTSRRRRSRQRSDASTRGIHDFSHPRTDSSRQSFSEESGRNSAQPETRQRHPAGSDGREMRQVSRNSNDRNSPKRDI
ncbi:MAG: hypothetical protein Q9164_004146 [Protoblastenia rupestris]